MPIYKLQSAFNRFTKVPMSLGATGWWDGVPSAPGWYFIETDTPLPILEQLPAPAQGTKLYDISGRIRYNNWLRQNGLAILPPPSGGSFVVYAGEQRNLKNRAREHTHGNPGTGCLRLSAYPQLANHAWSFSYLTCDSVFPGSNGDKALRALGEQTWRGLHGWPLFCKE